MPVASRWLHGGGLHWGTAASECAGAIEIFLRDGHFPAARKTVNCVIEGSFLIALPRSILPPLGTRRRLERNPAAFAPDDVLRTGSQPSRRFRDDRTQCSPCSTRLSITQRERYPVDALRPPGGIVCIARERTERVDACTTRTLIESVAGL